MIGKCPLLPYPSGEFFDAPVPPAYSHVYCSFSRLNLPPLFFVDHALAEDTIQLEQMLSADEQAQLGISNMPLAKRDALRGALIRMYQQGYQAAKGAGRLSAGNGSGAIETQVDGEFNGWEGETIVKLLNGQIWQQTEYHYEYHYAYMPKVLVYAAGGGYKMKVDGASKAIGVQRLR